jgi:hypothetical protein
LPERIDYRKMVNPFFFASFFVSFFASFRNNQKGEKQKGEKELSSPPFDYL